MLSRVFLAVALLAATATSSSSEQAKPLSAQPALSTLPLSDLSKLSTAIGTARFVALGEATHGTHEFYRERARISELLIRDQDFGAVVIEGDWPEAERVNRYVRGLGSDRTAKQALSGFTRFPRWMWRNAEFAQFIDRLRAHNQARPLAERVGVYGMDVYNLADSISGVGDHLDRMDPAMAARVGKHYRCFARYHGDTHRYGQAARSRSCRTSAEAALSEVKQLPRGNDPLVAESRFAVIGNAAAVAGAEEYFRTLYAGSFSWNARDRRMAATVADVAEHVGALRGRTGRVIVWAHNSHVGDARATDAVNRGELNLGQLLRQQHGSDAFLLGFLTHGGTTMAASEWGARGQVRNLHPALPESYAGLLHSAGVNDGLLLFRGAAAVDPRLAEARLQRAIGVIYKPESERLSHYFRAALARQFDAVIYLAQTRAVTSLD